MGDVYAKASNTNRILICCDGETAERVTVGGYYVTVEKHTIDTAVVRVGDTIGYEEKQVFTGKTKRMHEGSIVITHERG
jgi:hypothetical protein